MYKNVQNCLSFSIFSGFHKTEVLEKKYKLRMTTILNEIYVKFQELEYRISWTWVFVLSCSWQTLCEKKFECYVNDFPHKNELWAEKKNNIDIKERYAWGSTTCAWKIKKVPNASHEKLDLPAGEL